MPKAGKHVTFIPFVTAAGEVLAVFYVLSGRLMADRIYRADFPEMAASSSVRTRNAHQRDAGWPRYYCVSKTGYVNARMWKNIILRVVEDWRSVPGRPDPIFLMDHFSAHIDKDVIDTMLDMNAHAAFLPANTTHVLQPLDNNVFANFQRALKNLLMHKLGPAGLADRPISTLLLALAPEAEAEALTTPVIKKAFETTGVHPWNKKRFLDLAAHSCREREFVPDGAQEVVDAARRVVEEAVQQSARDVSTRVTRTLRTPEQGEQPMTVEEMARVTRENERHRKEEQDARAAASAAKKRQKEEERRSRKERHRRNRVERKRTEMMTCRFRGGPFKGGCTTRIWLDDDSYADGALWCHYCDGWGYCDDHATHRSGGLRHHVNICASKHQPKRARRDKHAAPQPARRPPKQSRHKK